MADVDMADVAALRPLAAHRLMDRPEGRSPAHDRQPAAGVAKANILLEAKGVACVPGSAFGEPRGLRLSYHGPPPQLAPGVPRLRGCFLQLRCRPAGMGGSGFG